MNNREEFLNIVTVLNDYIENNWVIHRDFLRTFNDLKQFIIDNKLGVWNTEAKGFDKYE